MAQNHPLYICKNRNQDLAFLAAAAAAAAPDLDCATTHSDSGGDAAGFIEDDSLSSSGPSIFFVFSLLNRSSFSCMQRRDNLKVVVEAAEKTTVADVRDDRTCGPSGWTGFQKEPQLLLLHFPALSYLKTVAPFRKGFRPPVNGLCNLTVSSVARTVVGSLLPNQMPCQALIAILLAGVIDPRGRNISLI